MERTEKLYKEVDRIIGEFSVTGFELEVIPAVALQISINIHKLLEEILEELKDKKHDTNK